MESNSITKREKILYINFNDDASCFCIGSQTGFGVYSTNLFKEIISRGK